MVRCASSGFFVLSSGLLTITTEPESESVRGGPGVEVEPVNATEDQNSSDRGGGGMSDNMFLLLVLLSLIAFVRKRNNTD